MDNPQQLNASNNANLSNKEYKGNGFVISKEGDITVVNLLWGDEIEAYENLMDETGNVYQTIEKIVFLIKESLEPIQRTRVIIYSDAKNGIIEKEYRDVQKIDVSPEEVWKEEGVNWGLVSPILYLEVFQGDNVASTFEVNFNTVTMILKPGEVVISSSIRPGGIIKQWVIGDENNKNLT